MGFSASASAISACRSSVESCSNRIDCCSCGVRVRCSPVRSSSAGLVIGTIFCMMNRTSPERVRQDCRLIGQALMRLALPRLLVRALVLGVAAIIWLLVAFWLLDFGRGLSFDNLQALGQQTTGFLARINPYVWWGVVVIWTLIISFIARGWLASDVAAARARPVPADEP